MQSILIMDAVHSSSSDSESEIGALILSPLSITSSSSIDDNDMMCEEFGDGDFESDHEGTDENYLHNILCR